MIKEEVNHFSSPNNTVGNQSFTSSIQYQPIENNLAVKQSQISGARFSKKTAIEDSNSQQGSSNSISKDQKHTLKPMKKLKSIKS